MARFSRLSGTSTWSLHTSYRTPGLRHTNLLHIAPR